MLAQLDLSQCVILDTETTGIGFDDEVIELAIIRADNGEVLFNQQFQPQRLISDEAHALHGITDAELIGKPQFRELLPRIKSLFEDKTVLGWRVGFDVRLLRQTMRRYRIDDNMHISTIDVRPQYIEYIKQIGLIGICLKSIHLFSSCENENIDVSDITPHGALDDCKLVYRLLREIRRER